MYIENKNDEQFKNIVLKNDIVRETVLIIPIVFINHQMWNIKSGWISGVSPKEVENFQTATLKKEKNCAFRYRYNI